MSVHYISDSVIVSTTGCSYFEGTKSYQNYSHELKALIKQWNPSSSWRPKDLRNCLPTFFAIEGLSSDVTEQYLGHASRSITARHYIPRLNSSSLGEGGELERMMNVFRRLVIQPLTKACRQRGSAEILNFFEPDESDDESSGQAVGNEEAPRL